MLFVLTSSSRTVQRYFRTFFPISYRTCGLSDPRTENQFVSYRVPVKSLLNVGANTLTLDFESAFIKVYLSPSIVKLSPKQHSRGERLRKNMANSGFGMEIPVVFMSGKPNTSSLAPYVCLVLHHTYVVLKLWVGLGCVVSVDALVLHC